MTVTVDNDKVKIDSHENHDPEVVAYFEFLESQAKNLEEELEELSVQNRETNQPTMTLVYLTTNYKAEIGQLTNLQRLDLSYSDYFDYY